MASIQSKTSKAGKKTFYVVISHLGKHKWLKAGTHSDAKRLKSQVESLENSQRVEKLGLVRRSVGVRDFFQEYLDHVKMHAAPNTVKRYKAALNAFLAFLRLFQPKVTQLAQIRPETIENYQRQRLTSIELKIQADGEKPGNHRKPRLPLPQTVNYEISVLRSVLTFAHDRELIPSVPTKKVRKLKPKAKRKARLLSAEECTLLLETADKLARSDPNLRVYAQAYRFLLNTGLRSGELCNLTWEDVDLKTGLITIQEKSDWSPKSYAREFFLNIVSVRLLKSMAQGGRFVFADSKDRKLECDNLRLVLIRVAKAAGLIGLTRVHDLRHTFNSLMQMNGVDPATMGTILGHKDIETTMIYTHQTQEHLKRSIEILSL